MRSSRLLPRSTAVVMSLSLAFGAGQLASAQSVSDAEKVAQDAAAKVDSAESLVDEAVVNRAEVEAELAVSIERINEIAASLSQVGTDLDRLAAQLGYADVELAGIQDQIEVQAIDAYMTVIASPSMSLVASDNVEMAMVATSVVDGVVSDGRARVDELFTKRRSLEELRAIYLQEQDEFSALQEELDAEVAHLTDLYRQADEAVAKAIVAAEAAEAEHRAALSAVDMARAREEERKRQEARSTTTTTQPKPTTTSPPNSTTPTTQPTSTSTTTGGGGNWDFPPHIEQWRPLVTQFFPASRVNEALAILRCESNGDPDAYNPYSGASGLFQFLPSTWASSAPKAGYGGHSVFEAEANIATAAWLGNRYEDLGLYFWQPWSCKRVLP